MRSAPEPRATGKNRWHATAKPRDLVIMAAVLVAAVAAALVVVLGGNLTGGSTGRPSGAAAGGGTASSGPSVRASAASRPNIVFVLTDDLSMDLLRFMPHVQAMERHGLTFSNYFVSDSLCCPSRASIFSGNFPHDTGVYTNVGAHGGFNVFHLRGEEQHTFATALQATGYRTAMMGKYLNGYLQPRARAAGVTDRYVPPGWSEWDVAGWGYPQFNYTLNENGTLHYYGHQPSDYLTDVLSRRGVHFINTSAATHKPFFLEVATFAPHTPYTPAPRDRNRFPGLTAPRRPSFDVAVSHPPDWLANHRALSASQIAQINYVFRRRAQSVLAVDRMIGKLEQALAAHGLARNTYLVFSSDNGYHMGDYRLMPGKLTVFDTDIRVPLVVIGPGVPAGTTTAAMAENVDLAKTFTAIGSTSFAADGHSLLPVLQGTQPANWRNAILVEHEGPDSRLDAADFQEPGSGNPESYEALRTSTFVYAEYKDGQREFYDLTTDPFELHNVAATLTPGQRAHLHAELLAIRRCHTGSACWAAMHVSSGP